MGAKRKYRNRKTSFDGIVFDSQKEARRYNELRLMQEAGIITELRRQVPFVLIPTQYTTVLDKFGRKKRKVAERKVEYIADFVYRDRDRGLVVEDVKGYKHGAAYNLFVIKRKLMLSVHHIEVTEI